MKDYFSLTFLRTRIVLALIAGVVAVLAVALAGDWLEATLGLDPRAIGYLSAIMVVAIAVAILWRAALRDWARQPGDAGGRKNDKQRS